jgi:A/G-specific adenine glycosylase
MKQNEIVRALPGWFASKARDLPWRHTRDPYAIWVSEVMLQQTQVKTVLPYWRRWMRALPHLESLAEADMPQLHKLWEGLGYYNRVLNLRKAARLIVERHGGRFPTEFDAVLELPGIGPYTAGAICSIAFDQPRPILDGNIIRVLTRLFGISGNARDGETNRRLWRLSHRLVTKAASTEPHRSGASSRFNQSLMELGALVCTPRQPRCEECPVATGCYALKHDRVETLPNLGPRAGMVQRRFAAFLVCRESRFLVRQRPAGGINAHLWEFPNLEMPGPKEPPQDAARRLLGMTPTAIALRGTLKHSITRSRISLEVFGVEGITSAPAPLGGQWLTHRQMARRPFTAAHKKILERFVSVGPGGGIQS